MNREEGNFRPIRSKKSTKSPDLFPTENEPFPTDY
jgi:hypothetical protein